MRYILVLAVLAAFSSCNEEDLSSDAAVRGLKTHLVEETQRSTVRRFPSVLEPTSLNSLSFEVSGKLSEFSLQVGQRVDHGDVLASLDPAAFEIQVGNAEAGVVSAKAAAKNATDTLARQEELLSRGTATRVTVDAAKADADAMTSQLEQAQKSLESEQDSFKKSVLRAPFDGIINSVDVKSFATVSPGNQILSLYSPDAFEVSFSVNFDTANQLVVGTPAQVRLADRPDVTLRAVVTELGSRADTVSSFPIVLTVRDGNPILKAGIAVEAAIELPLPAAEGFTIPLSAVIKEGDIRSGNDSPNDPGPAEVFVYDASSETVVRREVIVAGVRENSLLIIDGLAPGERVASAGVSFLRDGQKVKLLVVGE